MASQFRGSLAQALAKYLFFFSCSFMGQTHWHIPRGRFWLSYRCPDSPRGWQMPATFLVSIMVTWSYACFLGRFHQQVYRGQLWRSLTRWRKDTLLCACPPCSLSAPWKKGIPLLLPVLKSAIRLYCFISSIWQMWSHGDLPAQFYALAVEKTWKQCRIS